MNPSRSPVKSCALTLAGRLRGKSGDCMPKKLLPGASSFSQWSRRSFLKASLATTVLPKIRAVASVPEARKHLPPIPTVHDLAGDQLVHVWRDLYNSPATQNEYGYVQATKSVSGLTALSIPPYGCCGVPDTPWSPGFLLSCELFLNGRILISYPDGGDEVAYTWHPHRVVRETQADGLKFTTEMFMPPKR